MGKGRFPLAHKTLLPSIYRGVFGGKGRFPLAHKTLLTWAGEVSPSHETQPPLFTEGSLGIGGSS